MLKYYAEFTVRSTNYITFNSFYFHTWILPVGYDLKARQHAVNPMFLKAGEKKNLIFYKCSWTTYVTTHRSFRNPKIAINLHHTDWQ